MIKFTGDTYLSNLLKDSKTSISEYFNKPYALSNTLIAKLAINSLQIDNEKAFLQLVSTYKVETVNSLPKKPIIQAVKVHYQDRLRLEIMRTQLLTNFDIKISTTSLFKLAMLSLTYKKQEDINVLLLIFESDNTNKKK